MRQAIAGVRWGWVVAAGLALGRRPSDFDLATVRLEGQTMTTPKTIGTLIKADPRLDALIAPDTKNRGARLRLRLVGGPDVGAKRWRLPALLRYSPQLD